MSTTWFQSDPDLTGGYVVLNLAHDHGNQAHLTHVRAGGPGLSVALSEADEEALLAALTKLRDWRRERDRAAQVGKLRELLAEHDAIVRKLAELYDGPPVYVP